MTNLVSEDEKQAILEDRNQTPERALHADGTGSQSDRTRLLEGF